jgi:hypothetical protein
MIEMIGNPKPDSVIDSLRMLWDYEKDELVIEAPPEVAVVVTSTLSGEDPQVVTFKARRGYGT